MGGQTELKGPDFARDGVAAAELAEGAAVIGQAHGEAVVMVRSGGVAYCVGASCTHYGGPLAEGLVAGPTDDLGGPTIRCPWHHARFDLRSGEAVGAPALAAIPCFSVEQRGERLYALRRSNDESKAPGGNPRRSATTDVRAVVIVGSGAAGAVAAEGLRREGFEGSITLLGADGDDPVDRPNLSKDFLAGTAPAEWIPLRGDDFYAEHRIEHRRNTRVAAIDVQQRNVRLASGDVIPFGALVLATGAEPVRLNIPGAERALVLRSLDDSRRIVERAGSAKRAVVIGSGFIGLEAAASLRARGLEVHVVGREALPLEHVLGRELGELLRDVHVGKGVQLHLGTTPRAIEEGAVVLADGTRIEAELVVMGVGVKPRTELAEAAGIACDRGVLVDDHFRTNVPGVFAIGDVARFPDVRSNAAVRVEHWCVAEQHGLAVARTIAGRGSPYRRAPFFWSAHHDVVVNYVGHAEGWDRVDVAGSVRDRDCAVAYRKNGRTLAVATIGRDRDALRAAAALESDDEAALRAIVPMGT